MIRAYYLTGSRYRRIEKVRQNSTLGQEKERDCHNESKNNK
jgi:hypothetical protein